MAESDAALMDLHAGGDHDALRQLQERHDPMLRRYLVRRGARQEDLDDLAQESWIRVDRRADSYDRERPFLRWLLGIATNLFKDFAERRSAQEQIHVPMDEAKDLTSRRTSEEDWLIYVQFIEEIDRMILRLPPRLIPVVLMHYSIFRMPEQEIAEALEIPVGTVRTRMHYAMKRLRKMFEESEE